MSARPEAYADYLTLNAPSLYALLPEAVSEHVSFLAPLGIAAAGLLTAGVLLALFLNRKRVTDRALLAGGAVLAIGIPFLLPHMHDRYFFLADVLTLILACMDRRRIPQAALVQIASLGAYYAYLKLKYALPYGAGRAADAGRSRLGYSWALPRPVPPNGHHPENAKKPPSAAQTGACQMMLTPGSAVKAPHPPVPWHGPSTGSPCRLRRHPDVAALHGDENLYRLTLADGQRHGGGDLPQQAGWPPGW